MYLDYRYYMDYYLLNNPLKGVEGPIVIWLLMKETMEECLDVQTTLMRF